HFDRIIKHYRILSIHLPSQLSPFDARRTVSIPVKDLNPSINTMRKTESR
ncbi:MAG: hypothetical protein ACI92E_001208, partial [Oceanicoccus sp.]